MELAADRMDKINRAAWRDKESISWFVRAHGYTDPGEQSALDELRGPMEHERILDLGVGAGRTVPLLRAVSSNYVAVDYTPELVAACRQKYPDVDVRVGDARDLSQFADGSFGLVVFSFNGIDSVNPKGRMKVLHEAYRVLKPGGVFLFSAHNQLGPGHGERLSFGLYPTRNPLKLAGRVLRAMKNAAHTLSNYARYSRLNYRGEGYSIMNASAHNHGIVIHYITLEKQLAQLEQAGFLPNPHVYENLSGSRLAQGADTREVWWFHFLARKPT